MTTLLIFPVKYCESILQCLVFLISSQQLEFFFPSRVVVPNKADEGLLYHGSWGGAAGRQVRITDQTPYGTFFTDVWIAHPPSPLPPRTMTGNIFFCFFLSLTGMVYIRI
jgi:hypothetical protein